MIRQGNLDIISHKVKRAILLAIFVFISALLSFAENEINSKAGELIKGKSSRIEKIMSVYSFVRDEIRQKKTEFT